MANTNYDDKAMEKPIWTYLEEVIQLSLISFSDRGTWLNENKELTDAFLYDCAKHSFSKRKHSLGEIITRLMFT